MRGNLVALRACGATVVLRACGATVVLRACGATVVLRACGATVLAWLLASAAISGCNGSSCASSRDCSGSGQVCDFDRGVCVECVTFVDCLTAGQICSANRCVTPTPCTSSRECTGQVCDTGLGHCVDCLTASDCSPGQGCSAGSCVGGGTTSCTTNRDCSGGTPHCDTVPGRCVECLRPSDCSGGETCQSNLCVAASFDGGPRDAGFRVDAGPRDAGFRFDAGPRDAGRRDAGGLRDAALPSDASTDPCASADPALTSGCHGGQGVFAAAPSNTFGGVCTVVPDSPPNSGTCIGSNVLCADDDGVAGVGMCVRTCVPSVAAAVSTGDCPVGARCFTFSDGVVTASVCLPDCSIDDHCATNVCALDGSCLDG